MRATVAPMGLLLAMAACQTSDRGTPETIPEAKAALVEAAAAEIEVSPIAAPADPGQDTGIGCDLEMALACGENEVDGCLTGQSVVHECKSMSAL